MSEKPKKAKVKVTTLVDKVYKNGFIFVAGPETEVNKYFEEQNVDYFIEPNLDGVCASKGADHYIYIERLDVGILVHECVHAAQASMDYRGVETGRNNTEIVAHLTQWLFDKGAPFYLKYFTDLEKQNGKK